MLRAAVAKAKFPQVLLPPYYKVKYSRVLSEKTWKHHRVL